MADLTPHDNADWFEQNKPQAPPFTPTANTAGQLTDMNVGGRPLSTPITGGTNLSTFGSLQNKTAAATNGKPPTLNPSDATSRMAFINYYASQPGANPSLKNDPGYWDREIASGRLGADPNYIVMKFMRPEGAPAGTFGSLLEPYPGQAPDYTNYPAFQMPTGEDALKQDPGYHFRVSQGEQALQQSAAARGTLNTGGSLKSVLDYGQNAASQEYGNVFDRALKTYTANYGTQIAGNYSNLYQRYLDQAAQFRGRQQDTANVLLGQQQLGVQSNA